MDLRARASEGGQLDLEFVGERGTVLYLLKERLLEDEKVDIATVLTDHPMLAHPRLVIRATDGKAEAALKRAAASLRKDLDELEDMFLKSLQ